MRIDLHTHTHRSGDSTTTMAEFCQGVDAAHLDYVAVTDHLTIEGAVQLRGLLGARIIIGQEMRVTEGELIGLFLERQIPPGLRAAQAAARIREQGGLVYAPHAGDGSRVSLSLADLGQLCENGLIDIVEVANSKAKPSAILPGTEKIAQLFGVAEGAGSDAHVESALGSTYVDVGDAPVSNPAELLAALRVGSVHATYCDPPRAFRSRIVPASG